MESSFWIFIINYKIWVFCLQYMLITSRYSSYRSISTSFSSFH
nr:MAG TPA: hypothetical protein [Caudoviricetes sp.]